MKRTDFFRSLCCMMLLCALFGSTTASAYDVSVNHDDDGYFSGTSSSGIRFRFQLDSQDNDYSAWIYEVEVNGNKTVTLPSTITISSHQWDSSMIGKTVAVDKVGKNWNSCTWRYDEKYSVVVPPEYTYMDGFGNNNEVIFQGDVPPVLCNRPNECRILVPSSSISTYRQYCSDNKDGWNSDMKVIPDNYVSLPPVTVNVSSAGNLDADLASVMASQGLSYDEVYHLEVNGAINGRDMNVVDKLPYLCSLDIASTTGLEKMRNCNGMVCLETVKLPTSVTEIESSAFNGCRALLDINLDNVVTIGSSAFSDCSSLQSISMNDVIEIGSEAFYSCSSLQSVSADNVENIGQQAFRYCSRLQLFSGKKVKSIGEFAFCNCSSLESIDFPKVSTIGWCAFAVTGLKEFHIYDGIDYESDILDNSKVEKLYLHTNRSFRDVRDLPYLTDVYIYDPIPGDMVRDDTQASIPRLHVPGFSYDNYIDNPNYYGFEKVLPLDENLTSLKVYDDLTISSNESLAAKFDLSLSEGALQNNASASLSVGDYTQTYQFNDYWDWNGNENVHKYGPSTTFINNGTVTADNVKVVIRMHDGWNFISLPYDVNVKDIVTPSEALWVVREYDGSIRANRSEQGDNSDTQSAWINVVDNSVLKGGKGYILHFSSNNGSEFTFPAANETRNNIFRNSDVSVPLTEYPSEFDHNASWNLVGNPYDACFDTRDITYNAPITVWNSDDRTYEAFSLVDDNYVLTPFQGFFVQATGSNTSMKFDRKGRYHDFEEASAKRNAPRKMVASNPSRALINLYVSGNGASDRTRLVINEEASEEYEISCDASKFLSTDEAVPQIFMLEKGQRYAIDERPMGAGEFSVGAVFGADGEYTISSESRNSDYNVILRDAMTGTETDITDQEYSFFSAKGSDASRFSIRLDSDPNAAEAITAEKCEISFNAGMLSVRANGEISVYSLDGKLVADGIDALDAQLPKGVYVVKAAGKAKKVTF